MGLLHKNHHHAAPPVASNNVHGMAAPVNPAGHAPISNHHAPGMHAPHPGPAPNTAGPHRHDLLNKLDPTVDSRSGGVQLMGPGIPPNAMSQQPMTAGAGNYTTAAPYHNSRVADTVDPRVDTRADRHVMHGAGPMATGPEAGYSHHSTRMGDTVDPRMEPGLDHRAHGGMRGPASVPRGGIAQPGPATKTAGPHHSNLMNRLDPAVDHKATYGGAPQYRTA
ncbi:unnamed protein product [Clonostachys rhizophaga]|uniref:Uncharacterized protein n=1 Tax=Clonostachys rhizophaga TaxID=160324 RepID=A0A9N9VD07_9HYPO|nr:unnamed protein product [Clonostachys rhizophaga]